MTNTRDLGVGPRRRRLRRVAAGRGKRRGDRAIRRRRNAPRDRLALCCGDWVRRSAGARSRLVGRSGSDGCGIASGIGLCAERRRRSERVTGGSLAPGIAMGFAVGDAQGRVDWTAYANLRHRALGRRHHARVGRTRRRLWSPRRSCVRPARCSQKTIARTTCIATPTGPAAITAFLRISSSPCSSSGVTPSSGSRTILRGTACRWIRSQKTARRDSIGRVNRVRPEGS